MIETVLHSIGDLIQNGDTYLFLIPIYSALLIGERCTDAFWTGRKWDLSDTKVNLLITLTTLVINVVVGHLFPLAIMYSIHQNMALWSLQDIPLGWALAFILYDLAWYIDHRIGHRVGFFWAMHQVHHSSTQYNTTVASRGFIFDITLINRPMFYVLPLLGVTPFQFICVSICTNIWGIAQHTQIIKKRPILDLFFATPSNHRVHHGRDKKYIDKNFGEVLILWDRLFGTYQKEEEPPSFGVIEPINTTGFFQVQLIGFKRLFHKLNRTQSWTVRVKHLIGPPEWSPEDSAHPDI